MTILAWIWLGVFLLLTGLSLRRPIWAVALYFLTYFALPAFWWWGEALADQRWNLIAGVILAVAVTLDLLRREKEGNTVLTRHLRWLLEHPARRGMVLLSAAVIVNAVLVHVFLAPDVAVSLPALVYLVKHTVLAFLIFAAIRQPGDRWIFVASLLLGMLYISCAVIFFGEGTMVRGRLEHVGPANAQGSNGLAALLFVLLPLGWGPLFHGKLAERMLALPAFILTLQVIHRCNSRGAFLSAIVAMVVVLVLAPRQLKKSWAMLCLFGVVLSFGFSRELTLLREKTNPVESQARSEGKLKPREGVG